MGELMTKYTITTTDLTEAKRALAAADLCSVLWDLREELRRDWKYHENNQHGSEWWDVLQGLMDQHGIDLEGLWQ